MNFLRYILLLTMLVGSFSLTAGAQRQPEGKKQKPPKNSAEIKPENKKPKNNERPENRPRNEGRGRRP